MIRWPSDLTFTIDSSLPGFWFPAIRAAVSTWDAVMAVDFREVSIGPSPLAFVPLDAALSLPGVPANWFPDAVNVTIHNGDVGIASYVGLDTVPDGWSAYATVLHEIGHAWGLTDQPLTPGSRSLMGYAAPHPTGLTPDVVQFAQQNGADDGDNLIELTGTASGSVRGGLGNDTIIGADGDCILYGNQGDDFLVGGGNADTLFGGQGNDLIDGGDGSDVMYGNLASDTLYGGAGLDILYGGQGDDVLYGGAGDTVFGGVGADTLYVGPLAVIGQHDPADTIHQWLGV